MFKVPGFLGVPIHGCRSLFSACVLAVVCVCVLFLRVLVVVDAPHSRCNFFVVDWLLRCRSVGAAEIRPFSLQVVISLLAAVQLAAGILSFLTVCHSAHLDLVARLAGIATCRPRKPA